jgi:hypothetical protein
MLMEFSSTLKQAIPPVPCRLDIRLLSSSSARRAARSIEGECKLVCLLACMMAEPFPDCLGYDVLLRPWFAPLDLSFHRRTRQILD